MLDSESFHLVRFLNASVLNRYGYEKIFDFRAALAYIMIVQGIEAMRSRLIISGNDAELKLFNRDVANTELWIKLLLNRYDQSNLKSSRYRIGYVLPK